VNAPEAPEGLSQFLRKVLDQLSLSSWLPAIMLVGCGALLVQLAVRHSLDIPTAVLALAEKPLGSIVIALFALILAAIVIQAFSFEIIRFLEGYWGANPISAMVARLLIIRQRRRIAKLRKRHRRLELSAFDAAKKTMLHRQIDRDVIVLLEDRVYQRVSTSHAPAAREAANEMGGWRPFAKPEKLAPIDRLLSRIADYPEPHRIMPTKLGNVLRSVEDDLVLPDGDLEGMVMRRYDVLPARLRTHHDQFRTRLDMYCTLVFVFIALATLSVVTVVNSPAWTIALIVPTALLLLAAFSYSAAVTSARGYGAVLRAIQREQNMA
jgi:hypothetical protein